MKRPVIGITAVTSVNQMRYVQRVTYVHAIRAAGGEAILLPCNPDKSNCRQIVSMLDGILVPGGADIDPVLYGEEKKEECDWSDSGNERAPSTFKPVEIADDEREKVAELMKKLGL